jgi:hypothetical protein
VDQFVSELNRQLRILERPAASIERLASEKVQRKLASVQEPDVCRDSFESARIAR